MRVLPIIFIFIIPFTAFAEDLGTFGKTYPIAEPDAIEEMQNAAKKVDWGKVFNAKSVTKRLHDYSPRDHAVLPKAEKNRVRQVDMSYTLEFDVFNPTTGEVMYPKGYTFNPLDFVTFHKKVVVIDGSDPDQVDWFLKSKYAKDANTVLHITGGVFYEVSEKVKRSVFFATQIIVKRFQFEYVPSVAYEDNSRKRMEVLEFDIDDQKKQ